MNTNFKKEFVIKLHKKSKSTQQILDKGKSLNNKMFVKRTVDCYNEINSIKDRKHAGQPSSIRRLSLIKNAREKIHRNPKRLMNKLAKEAKISRTSMQRFVENETLQIKKITTSN